MIAVKFFIWIGLVLLFVLYVGIVIGLLGDKRRVPKNMTHKQFVWSELITLVVIGLIIVYSSHIPEAVRVGITVITVAGTAFYWWRKWRRQQR